MQFIDIYVIPGLVLGCIYAISSSALVMTYSTSGVLNIGFGAMAYAVAMIFYELRTLHHFLSPWPALALCVLVIGPLMGIAFWQGLFRWMVPLGLVPTLIASIGIAVALPALCVMAFVPGTITYAAGMSNNGVDLHRIGSIVFSVDQAYAVGAALVVAIALFVLLRFTSAGLKMRAVFDSPAVAGLTGTNPGVSSNLSWAIGGALAAIGGVFLAPVVQLNSAGFLTLTVASLAAALVGGLRSIAITFAAALLIGVGSSAITDVNGSQLVAIGAGPSLPFIVMLVVVLLRRNPIDIGQPVRRISEVAEQIDTLKPFLKKVAPATVLILIAPALLNGYWTGVVGLGLIYAVIFLGFTVALGFGGVLTLGQAGLAGIGGFVAGDLTASYGIPLLIALLCGALLAALIAGLLALIGGRLSTLEFGLLTLAFGLFVDNFLYNWSVLVPLLGTNFGAPSLFGIRLLGTARQYYLFAAVLGLALLGVAWFRRRLWAFYISAGRTQPDLAQATGVNTRGWRVMVFAVAAFLAAIGGGLLGIYQKELSGTDLTTLTGLTWLAVVVFMGVRSASGAVAAGLVYAVFPALISQWLPVSWGPLSTVLFGLGALTLLQNPRGAVAAQKDQIAWVAGRIRTLRARGEPT